MRVHIGVSVSNDAATSMGRLIFHINSAHAEFEREIIRDRVIIGIKAKREKTGTWGRRALREELQEKKRR